MQRSPPTSEERNLSYSSPMQSPWNRLASLLDGQAIQWTSPPTLTFGNAMTFHRNVSQQHQVEINEAGDPISVVRARDQLTDCLSNRNIDDVWVMAKLPPSTGCPPTVMELTEGILRRLDYAIRERSQDPYDIEILWSVDVSCYVVIGVTDSEATE